MNTNTNMTNTVYMYDEYQGTWSPAPPMMTRSMTDNVKGGKWRAQVPLLSDKQEKGRHKRRMRETFMTMIEMDGKPPSWNLCACCGGGTDEVFTSSIYHHHISGAMWEATERANRPGKCGDALEDLVQGVCEECRTELWFTQLEDYPEDYIAYGEPGHDECYNDFIDEMHELY